MKQEFKMEQEEMNDIIKINKNQTPVMRIGETWTGMDLQEKINNYWKKLEEKYGFDKDTVEASGKGKLYFLAVAKHIKTEEEKDREKYNDLSEIVKQLESCNYTSVAGPLEKNIAFIVLQEKAGGLNK